MSPDEIVRRAALLLRSGAVPVSEFVEALDDASRRAVRRAIARLPETLRARDNAERLAAGTFPCVGPADRGSKIHAFVRRGGRAIGTPLWPACGALSGKDSFLGRPTCATCLKALTSGTVGA